MNKSKKDPLVESYLSSGNVDPEVLEKLLHRDIVSQTILEKHAQDMLEREVELSSKECDLEIKKTKFQRKEKQKKAELKYLQAMHKLQSQNTHIETKNMISVSDFNGGLKAVATPSAREVHQLVRPLANDHGFVLELKHNYDSSSSYITLYLKVRHIDGHCELFRGGMVVDLSQNTMSSGISAAITIVQKKLQMEAFGITFSAHESIKDDIDADSEDLASVPADAAEVNNDEVNNQTQKSKFIDSEQLDTLLQKIGGAKIKENSVINSVRLGLKIRPGSLKEIPAENFKDVEIIVDKMISDKNDLLNQKKTLKQQAVNPASK